MRSTNRVSRGFVSACLGGSLPYFWFVVFALWKVGRFLHTSWTVVRRPLQSKCWRRVCYVRVSPGWQSISWYKSTVFFCSALGKHILLFRHIRRWSLSPPRKDHRLIFQNNKICLPRALQKKTVDWYHEMLYHPGETRTEHTLCQHFDWRGLLTTVHDVCKKCPTFQTLEQFADRKSCKLF